MFLAQRTTNTFLTQNCECYTLLYYNTWSVHMKNSYGILDVIFIINVTFIPILLDFHIKCIYIVCVQ